MASSGVAANQNTTAATVNKAFTNYFYNIILFKDFLENQNTTVATIENTYLNIKLKIRYY